jgi:hypothetical protein
MPAQREGSDGPIERLRLLGLSLSVTSKSKGQKELPFILSGIRNEGRTEVLLTAVIGVPETLRKLEGGSARNPS